MFEVTHDVFEGLSDRLVCVAPLHDHDALHVLQQFGFSGLQEALGTPRLRFSENTAKPPKSLNISFSTRLIEIRQTNDIKIIT